MSTEQNPRDEVGGGQTSEVSGLDTDGVGTQEVTPPADLTQHRAQGPARDYRADAPGEQGPNPEVDAVDDASRDTDERDR